MTYANTVGGQILPVIDITDPRFALPTDSSTLAALFAAYEADEDRRSKIPAFITRLILAIVSRRAPLLHSFVSVRSGFLQPQCAGNDAHEMAVLVLELPAWRDPRYSGFSAVRQERRADIEACILLQALYLEVISAADRCACVAESNASRV